MRIDPPGSQLSQRHRDPRVVVGVIYDTGSIYVSSRPGIANVPGNHVSGVLKDLSTTSQTISPELARTTIGTLSFTVVDVGGDVTAELREQLLVEGRGLKGKEVRVYSGDTDDFTDGTWQRVETYVVDGVTQNGRTYAFSCSDRNREQRVDIFEQQKTRLSTSLTASATSVVTTGNATFELLAHPACFSDAPSDTVGYIRVKQTGEIIRYTGKSGGNTFTGCTRGVFGTIPQACVVDGADEDRWPEIEEFIYLEGPGPWLDYAIKTGDMLGTSDTLPSRWHMGIDPAYVIDEEYERIGADLYDPADLEQGLLLRFTHLEQTDGKRFCEEQLHLPMLVYGRVDSLGRLGIRRITPILSNSSPVDVLSPNSVIAYDSVRHSLSRVVNSIVIEWNYNGKDYTRRDVFINAASIAKHGRSTPIEYSLRGLPVRLQSRTTLQHIANTMFERLGAPPIEASLRLSRSKNHLEIGDPVRVLLPSVRDFTNVDYLDRTVEIQGSRKNWLTGEVHAEVLASTERSIPDPGTTSVIPDAWYSSAGVALNTVLTMSGNNVTANGNLAGDVDLRDGVYYHLGDLTINAGVTVTVNENTQLRIRGGLTINGKIDAKGRGLSALADTNVVGVAPPVAWPSPLSTSGFLGSTRGGNSVRSYDPFAAFDDIAQGWYSGVVAAAPLLNLRVEGGALIGIPSDIRGTPGIYGGPVVQGPSAIVRALGGAGGDGGAGLMIVTRGGIAFGVSGQIDMSGADGSASSSVTLGGVVLYGGGGGGGAPGALYVIIDGDSDVDLSTALVANHGATPVTGTPKAQGLVTSMTSPGTGWDPGLGALDMFEEAHVVQYLAAEIGLGDSADEVVPAPTDLAPLADELGKSSVCTGDEDAR